MRDSYRLTPEDSDEVLVERVACRDVTAFTTLYDRYAPTIYTLAMHLLGAADAEETVQEVFLRLWNKAHQYDGERGSFRSWFMTIAHNCVKDELGRRNREDRLCVVDTVDELLSNMADPHVDVTQAVWLNERQETLLRGLRRLPAEQRRAIMLAYFGGFSQASIAQQMSWPLGTVKKRIRLGLQKLRMIFVHQDDIF